MLQRILLLILVVCLTGFHHVNAQESQQKEIAQPEFLTNPPVHTEKKIFAVGTAKNTSPQMLEMTIDVASKQAMVDTLRSRFMFWANQFNDEVGDTTRLAYRMEEVVSGFYVRKIESLKVEDEFETTDPDIPQLIYKYRLTSFPTERAQTLFLKYLGREQELYSKFIDSDVYYEMQN